MAGSALDGDLEVGEGLDDFGEFANGQGERTGAADFGLDAAADAEIEIGGGEPDGIVLGLEEDVAQDGHGGAGAHDIEHLLEAGGKMLAVDLELHGAQIRQPSRLLAMPNR